MNSKMYYHTWMKATQDIETVNEGFFSILKEGYQNKLRCEIEDGWIYLYSHPLKSVKVPYLKTRKEGSVIEIKGEGLDLKFHGYKDPQLWETFNDLIDDSIEEIPESWICSTCKNRNSHKFEYCGRCGHFKDSYKRYWQYEELSKLYENFLRKEKSFEKLVEEIRSLAGKEKSLLTSSLNDFVYYSDQIKPEEVECYYFYLNSLTGNYDYESMFGISSTADLELDKGILYDTNGLGTVKVSVKTIDHINYLLGYSFDGYGDGADVNIPLDVNYFLGVKTFLEHYAIELEDVWIPEKFRNEVWPFPKYELWREDDNGNRYLMRDFFIKSAAQKESDLFLARAHKQDYWVKEVFSEEGWDLKAVFEESVLV